MATTIFTPLMLRNGTRGVPEIESTATSTTSSIQFFTTYQLNDIGANPSTSTWPITISSSVSAFTSYFEVTSTYGMPVVTSTYFLHTEIVSSRGSSNYKNRRAYMQIPLGQNQGVPGTITAANIYLPVSKSSSDGVYGGELGIFLGSTGSVGSGNLLTNTNSDYEYYFLEAVGEEPPIGNKTLLSDFQTPTTDGLFTYPLNSTAISLLNDVNNSSNISESICFAVIIGNDYYGVAPTAGEVWKYSLALTASLFPESIPRRQIPTGNSVWVNPYIEFTYIPD